MIEFIRIDGTAVRVTSLSRRTVAGTADASLREVTLVIIARGEQTHRAVLDLAAPGAVTLEIPDEEGQGAEAFSAEVVSAGHVTTGSGEAVAYRHEITLREREPAHATGSPMPPSAFAAVDLVAIRLEALIEALEDAGVIDRATIDEIARRLAEN